MKARAQNGKQAAHGRAGGRLLALLGRPLVPLILRALAERPLRLAELQEHLGGPPATTLRARLAALARLGALERHGAGMPYAVHNALTDTGRELLATSEVLAAWLASAPGGSRSPGTPAAKASVTALIDAWESSIFRALAARPFTLGQLDALIRPLSYPALQRRLTAMRAAGLLERPAGQLPGSYAVTPWARQGLAPILAAARFEQRHLSSESLDLRPLDIEAAFLLATPIARLDPALDGICLLAAHLRGSRQLHGVRVAVDRGSVVECLARVEPRPSHAAIGAAPAWLDALVSRRPDQLHIGGGSELARGLVFGLHDSLFLADRHPIANGNGGGR
jgi:DNA-binding HxlR family transcriptional regulator